MSTDDVLFANNLIYDAPAASSVTINRVLKRQQFQNRTYSEGQTATCSFNTGTDFVDCKNSSLVVKIQVAGNGTNPLLCGFGSGSGMNLVRNIRIYHRSGTAYTNTQRMNLWRKTEDVFNESNQWFSTIGFLMGYGTGNQLIETDSPNELGIYTVVIPLNKVHPFFESEGGVFLPAPMASGLRVEIDLASVSEVFVANGSVGTSPPVTYTISDIYFNTMSISLMDSSQASINASAQSQSLEYVYKDIFTSQNSQPSDSSSINIDINRSVGYADHATCCIQLASHVSSTTFDSFTSVYYPGNWWYTLGSNQYPNQKIDDEKNAYSTALITYDKFKMGNSAPTSVNIGSFITNHGIYAVSLERDTALALSQSPVNSSRALRFEATLDAPIGAATLVTVFLTYICAARSSLLSSKIDI